MRLLAHQKFIDNYPNFKEEHWKREGNKRWFFSLVNDVILVTFNAVASLKLFLYWILKPY
jgi:hypothetical protein